MMSPKPLHNAFSFDYQSKKMELNTPCRIRNPQVPSAPFLDHSALWDTGATHSVIGLPLIESLKLTPIFREMISGVHGTQEADGFIVEIMLPNNVVCKNWPVMGADIGPHGLLIGMDIISMGDFSICEGRYISYCIPSFENPIDFVGKAEKVNKKIAKQTRPSSSKK